MTLEAEISQLRTENQELKRELIYATHELNQLKKMIFGISPSAVKAFIMIPVS